MFMKLYRINELEKKYEDLASSKSEVCLTGWVRTNRDSGKIGFILMNDGSTVEGIQVVYKKESTQNFEECAKARTGSAIQVKGTINFNEKMNAYELVATSFELLKQADEDYPLQKKQHSMEFLREIAHLRPRTKTMQAVMTVRNRLAYAIHNFFQKNDFMWVATPLITSNDCEGAGESFFIYEDKEKPFFQPQGTLTVSGQLNAEAYAQAFGRVYTFGPTFRADRSHTNRHLAEFWMIEPEIAFCTLPELMGFIELFIKSIVKDVLENCKEAIDFFAKEHPELKERLHNLVTKDFLRIEYRKAIEVLKEAVAEGHKFEDSDIFFGKDLASEHERYLCEQVYKSPVFLYNYPKVIKAFYMKQNEDNETVAACDLLVPGVGEIVGGSQREDSYDKIMTRVKEMNMDPKSIKWYVDLRKYGYHSSAGFGLGFERLIMYILGLDNVRDAIPFPRYEGKLSF